MRWKRIYLNLKKTKYCIIKLFENKEKMRAAYWQYPTTTSKDLVLGVHCPYEKYRGRKLSPETGTVFLAVEYCGAGIVSHELLHAVLWAHKHKRNKRQYPIVIENMRQEENILHNHTYAVEQFYRWYWKVVENK